jgi:hypothetical protein
LWNLSDGSFPDSTSSVGKSEITMLVVALSPFVERLARNPEMSAGPGHVARVFRRLRQPEAPVGQPPLL